MSDSACSPLCLQLRWRRSSSTIIFCTDFVHFTLSLRTDDVLWFFSPRDQNTIPEWANTEGTRVGARRGFLILRHESGPEIYGKLARILSRNCPEFFSPFPCPKKFRAKSTPPSGPKSTPILEMFFSVASLVLEPGLRRCFGCQYFYADQRRLVN